MKKKFVLFAAMIFSAAASAQDVSRPMDEGKAFDQEFLSLMSTKIFQDPLIVQEIILSLDEQNQENGDLKNITSNIFNDEDSAVLESIFENKKIIYNVTPELLKKASEDPNEAYKDVMMGVSIPTITSDEMDKLNQIDKKAVIRTIQMTTEAGPDFGAKPVSVIYDNEI